MDAFKGFCDRCASIRRPAARTSLVIQAEDELAAIGMVIGAIVERRARLHRRPAGPGISLMNEFLGLAYYAEVPAVVFDVQRVGPSTGMPTRTQQCDIIRLRLRLARRHAPRVPVPGQPGGMLLHVAPQAFDLAERLQTPVFVLSDLDIGMNDWMCRDLKWDDAYVPDRGKVLDEEQLDEAREVLALRRPRRRRHPLPHPPGRAAPRARTSRAAPATTSTAPTPRTRPSTRWCSTGCARSGSRPRRLVPQRGDRVAGGQRARHRHARQLRRRRPRGASTRLGRAGRARSTTCACAASRSARRSSTSSPRTSCNVRRRAESRRAAARAADARDRRREEPSCARSCTTTACRCPPTSSSTASWPRCRTTPRPTAQLVRK